MKPIIITLVMVFFLFALVTTIDAAGAKKQPAQNIGASPPKTSKPMFDYLSGEQIRLQDNCFIRAFWKGQLLYAGKMESSYVGLKSGPRPPRSVQVRRVVGGKGGFMHTLTAYTLNFNDSTLGKWSTDLASRKIETGINKIGVIGQVQFYETKEDRVYKMEFNGAKSGEVGIQVDNQNSEERYYLALVNSSMKRINFRFERA